MTTTALATKYVDEFFRQEEFGIRVSDAERLYFRIEADALSKSFYKFVQGAWHIIEPGVAFKDGWHIRKMCLELELCAARRPSHKRKIFNVPPGTSKSTVVNVLFPAWVWTRFPGKRFLLAAYGAHLSTRDNLRCRQLLESEWYQRRWQVNLVDDQNTKTNYKTTDGGWRISTSVNGVGTGEHPDFFIVDDPTSASQAESEAERNNANLWFDNTVSMRQGREPVIIVIMQRLHVDDLSGHLIQKGGWNVTRWPMRYQQCTCSGSTRCAYHLADELFTVDPTDERTTDGQLLFESMYPESKVKQMEIDLGSFAAAAQLDQNPKPPGGTLFQRAWFKFIDADVVRTLRVRWCRGWDTAGTEGGGDFTAGVKVGELPDGRFVVAEPAHGQWGPSNVDRAMLSCASQDGRGCMIREEKEGGASGKAVIDAHRTMLKAYDYAGVTIGTNKIIRSKPFRGQVEAGNVYLIRGTWNDKYLDEFASFTGRGDKHDDLVDGTSCAYNALVGEKRAIKPGGLAIGTF